MFEKILLPVDGSSVSLNAAKYAIMLAQAHGSFIYVLNVLESRPTSGVTMNILKKEGEEALEKVAQLFKKMETKPLKKEYMIKEGLASEEILNMARTGVDLIVIGGSGKHRLERFLLGSVAEKVVRDAKCPVLTVH
ncbi:universal stress protein [Methanobacterium alkalithermotolerans]|uniref:Universal stress protein n=1 Tax=Methanobacterium alkalithermotolerans TaxID=2731220 RepID=A0A8T8K450_9EURY|nr:universal stress protein [Methanobacterium alkalithermotolerans]QUH22699.1 universal stress protein [Methanobacterium alkalithermotolerans]